MKFEDYEASHVTPQKTLLKKFNEVLKYLRKEYDGSIFYIHKIHFTISTLNTWIFIISTFKESFKDYSFNDALFTKNYMFINADFSQNLILATKLTLGQGFHFVVKDTTNNTEYEITDDEVEQI